MRAVIFILLLANGFTGVSQSKLGNEWITGRGTTISFNTNPVSTRFDAITPWHYFKKGNSNICDANGRLVLCSDGYNVYDSIGNYIEGGDTLIPPAFYIDQYGSSILSQSSIFLPIDSNK